MKISDFKIAESFLRTVCDNYSHSFIDFPVVFDSSQNVTSFVDSKIVIGKTHSFSQTCGNIIGCYVQNVLKNIPQNELVEIMNTITAILRSLSYMPNGTSAISEGISSRLHRNQMIWIIIRDIVCPVYNVPVDNIKIVAAKSPYIDGGRYVKAGDFPTVNISDAEYPFIFVNLDLECQPARDAFLLASAIRGHNLDPRIVINDLLSKTELRTKFLGFVSAALVDDEAIRMFLTILMIVTNFENKDELIDKYSSGTVNRILTSQYNGADAWWFIALIEKLLGPARGSDWSTHETLKPLTTELWENVEKEKKARGLPELPLELLLRVQSEDFKQDTSKSIQFLLNEKRVW